MTTTEIELTEQTKRAIQSRNSWSYGFMLEKALKHDGAPRTWRAYLKWVEAGGNDIPRQLVRRFRHWATNYVTVIDLDGSIDPAVIVQVLEAADAQSRINGYELKQDPRYLPPADPVPPVDDPEEPPAPPADDGPSDPPLEDPAPPEEPPADQPPEDLPEAEKELPIVVSGAVKSAYEMMQLMLAILIAEYDWPTATRLPSRFMHDILGYCYPRTGNPGVPLDGMKQKSLTEPIGCASGGLSIQRVLPGKRLIPKYRPEVEFSEADIRGFLGVYSDDRVRAMGEQTVDRGVLFVEDWEEPVTPGKQPEEPPVEEPADQPAPPAPEDAPEDAPPAGSEPADDPPPPEDDGPSDPPPPTPEDPADDQLEPLASPVEGAAPPANDLPPPEPSEDPVDPDGQDSIKVSGFTKTAYEMMQLMILILIKEHGWPSTARLPTELAVSVIRYVWPNQKNASAALNAMMKVGLLEKLGQIARHRTVWRIVLGVNLVPHRNPEKPYDRQVIRDLISRVGCTISELAASVVHEKLIDLEAWEIPQAAQEPEAPAPADDDSSDPPAPPPESSVAPAEDVAPPVGNSPMVATSEDPPAELELAKPSGEALRGHLEEFLLGEQGRGLLDELLAARLEQIQVPEPEVPTEAIEAAVRACLQSEMPRLIDESASHAATRVQVSKPRIRVGDVEGPVATVLEQTLGPLMEEGVRRQIQIIARQAEQLVSRKDEKLARARAEVERLERETAEARRQRDLHTAMRTVVLALAQEREEGK